MRCAYVGNDASLRGFTLANGTTGVECESSAVVSNCVMTGNAGRGVIGGTLYDCVLTGNSDGALGGTLYNCTLTRNSGSGASGSTLYHCTLSGNSGSGASGSTLYHCTVDP